MDTFNMELYAKPHRKEHDRHIQDQLETLESVIKDEQNPQDSNHMKDSKGLLF